MDVQRGRAGDVPDEPDYSARLLQVIVDAIPEWIQGIVESRVARMPTRDDTRVAELVESATRTMLDGTATTLTNLFATDVAEQTMNPLQILREQASVVTDVLVRLGVPAAVRDGFDVARLPNDRYGIGPFAWRDLGERVHDAGITWGAWKAAVIVSRHRNESGTRQ